MSVHNIVDARDSSEKVVGSRDCIEVELEKKIEDDVM